MDSRDFEIFRKVPNGEPVWLETCASLDKAMERAAELYRAERGAYFIFDRPNLRFVDPFGDRSHVRVLVADDHYETRRSVCKALKQDGHIDVIGEVSNGREAVTEARKLHPDLIIMDLSMPELDGLTAAQLIKKFSPKTQIVMFSVHSGTFFQDLTEGLGIDGFVPKGSSSQKLLAAVDAVLHHQKFFPV